MNHMAAADHDTKTPDDASPARHSVTVLRIVLALCVVPLLVYLCLQTEHARLKGTSMDAWRLIPLILTAAAAAGIGKRFLNSISGLFFGGIGGLFGTLDQFAGPYGGIVGLLVGTIVVLLPVMQKPKLKDAHEEMDAEGSSRMERNST
ncbi:MAG: hypothetical protein ACC628_11460 [Pirellulaceae bacterium]